MNSSGCNPNYEGLRQQMRVLRKERKLTFDKLAELTGIDRRTVVALEHGETPGSLKSWYRVALALDVKPGEFFSVL